MEKGPFGKSPRLSGRAADGIRFQKDVHKLLGPALAEKSRLLEGPWLRYTDESGVHWCQPDHVAVLWDRVLVVETKLSLRQLKSALGQLKGLYKPALEHLFEKPVVMVVAFKYWVKGDDPGFELINSVRELTTVPLAAARKPYGWHTLGV